MGDAVAWQFYGCRALPIYVLGVNMCPGILFPSKRTGVDAEEEAVEGLWSEKGAFALRHGYTKCLRVLCREFIEPFENDCSHSSYNCEHNGI